MSSRFARFTRSSRPSHPSHHTTRPTHSTHSTPTTHRHSYHAFILIGAIEHGDWPKAVSTIPRVPTHELCTLTRRGKSLLHVAFASLNTATANGHDLLPLFAALIKAGVDVNGRTARTQMTPFHKAIALTARADLVQLMLGAGADATLLSGRNRRNALHLACARAAPDTVLQALLLSSDKLVVADRWGNTPLHLLCEADATATATAQVETLLACKQCDINATNDEGVTPLILAALQGNEDMVRLLIEHGADPTSRTTQAFRTLAANTTAFHAALTQHPTNTALHSLVQPSH